MPGGFPRKTHEFVRSCLCDLRPQGTAVIADGPRRVPMLRLIAFVIESWAYMLAILIVLTALLHSVRRIGPTEVGLVMKRLSWSKLANDNPIAFNGEAGYQADLLMPGLHWKPW